MTMLQFLLSNALQKANGDKEHLYKNIGGNLKCQTDLALLATSAVLCICSRMCVCVVFCQSLLPGFHADGYCDDQILIFSHLSLTLHAATLKVQFEGCSLHPW